MALLIGVVVGLLARTMVISQSGIEPFDPKRDHDIYEPVYDSDDLGF